MQKLIIIYCCKDCGNKIVYTTAFYGQGKCQVCNGKYLHKNGFINIKGKNNPNYIDGKTNKDYFCLNCGKKLSGFPAKKCRSCSKLGLKNPIRSHQMRGKNNPMFGKSGINSPVYIHGYGYLPYSKQFTQQLKLKIRQRDNFECQGCGLKESKHFRNLDIHHIDYNKLNCDKNNLITLCQQCNLTANIDRDYWFAFYTYILENFINV